MPKQAMDYSKTIIYKIVCNDLNIKETYVGHTTNMVKRRCQHKHYCNNEKDKMYDLKIYQTIRANGGWDNWSMIQICEFSCNNKEEARAEERRHYEMLNASLNMIKPIRYEGEKNVYQKEYRDANREEKAEYGREYREANRDKRAEYQKEWYETNKYKLAEKYTCCCGSIIRKHEKTRHEKTHKHLNYVKDSLLGLNTG